MTNDKLFIESHAVLHRAYSELKDIVYQRHVCFGCGYSTTQGHHELCKLGTLLKDIQPVLGELYLKTLDILPIVQEEESNVRS